MVAVACAFGFAVGRFAGRFIRCDVEPCRAGRRLDIASLASPLGAVHGRVGVVQQGLRVGSVAGVLTQPDAGRDIDARRIAQHKRLGQCDDDALHEHAGLCRVGCLCDDGELVAAPTAHRVGSAHAQLQPCGHLLQQLVTGIVAVVVVQRLELVEVDVDQRQRAVCACRPLDGVRQAVGEDAPVRQAGERILAGQAFEFGLGRGQHRNAGVLRRQRALEIVPPTQLAFERIGALLQQRDAAVQLVAIAGCVDLLDQVDMRVRGANAFKRLAVPVVGKGAERISAQQVEPVLLCQRLPELLQAHRGCSVVLGVQHGNHLAERTDAPLPVVRKLAQQGTDHLGEALFVRHGVDHDGGEHFTGVEEDAVVAPFRLHRRRAAAQRRLQSVPMLGGRDDEHGVAGLA